MSDRIRYRLLDAAAILVAVAAPLVATLCMFPGWIRTGSQTTVSGIALVCMLLAAIPLWRRLGDVKKLLQDVSAPVLWGILLILFWALRAIADEMVVISAAGLVGGMISVAISHVKMRYAEKEKPPR